METNVTAESISARLDRMPFLPFHFRMAATLGVGTLFDAFDALSIAAALTMIIATFHLDYKIGATIGFGFLGERIGRKWSYVIALAIFICAARWSSGRSGFARISAPTASPSGCRRST